MPEKSATTPATKVESVVGSIEAKMFVSLPALLTMPMYATLKETIYEKDFKHNVLR